MERESFGSRLGFLLVSAGCAIGIGNVWRFPYVAGENGGGVFVLFYLLFLIGMGLPVLTMELAVGRGGKKSAYYSYKELEKPGTKWHLHGWCCLIGCFMLMMYYTTVSGWMVCYLERFLAGSFQSGMSADEVAVVFTDLLSSPLEMTFWMALNVILGFIVCGRGLQNGIEKISKVMMTTLMALIIVLAVHSMLQPGALKGLRFYLVPDFKEAANVGIVNVIKAAMNQAFFTLSLGVGAMEIFGSYMSDENSLPGESAGICILDTIVAITSGLIIFPACFSFGVQPDAGPSLIFITLPNVFIHMAGGRFWGSLFFLFMTFASFSTVIAVFENIIMCSAELFHMSRKKAVIVSGVLLFIASLPCVLGYNVLSSLRFPGGRDVLDMEDFIVSNILLPVGSLIFCLFCVTRAGWGYDNYIAECNKGKGLKFSARLKPYFRIVLPVLVAVIIIQSLM